MINILEKSVFVADFALIKIFRDYNHSVTINADCITLIPGLFLSCSFSLSLSIFVPLSLCRKQTTTPYIAVVKTTQHFKCSVVENTAQILCRNKRT
jgi:hypothetical protein